MRLVPHDSDCAASILDAQPSQERGELAVGRELLHRDHVSLVGCPGKDLRRLDGAEERARREDVDRRHNRPQTRRAVTDIPAPIIREGTLRLVLSVRANSFCCSAMGDERRVPARKPPLRRFGRLMGPAR